MSSDEDFKFLSSFSGANVGNVFITTKLYLEFIFLFGLLFLSPRTLPVPDPYQVHIKSISSPYQVRSKFGCIDTEQIRT